MDRRGHAGVRLGWGAVPAVGLLMMLACDELSGFDEEEEPPPPPKEEKPWIPVAKKVLLDTYPRTENEGIEYCGMLCQQADEKVIATGPIPGTDQDCEPWKSPCPAGTKAIGTFHTHPIEPLNEGNPMRPFGPGDLEGTLSYEFIGQALMPRTKSGLLRVHVYMLERGIWTVCQVHPTVICPFPPIQRGATP